MSASRAKQTANVERHFFVQAMAMKHAADNATPVEMQPAPKDKFAMRQRCRVEAVKTMVNVPIKYVLGQAAPSAILAPRHAEDVLQTRSVLMIAGQVEQSTAVRVIPMLS